MKDHSLHLTFHDGLSNSKTKSIKNNKRDKASLKVREGQFHKEKKWFFCKKDGYLKKDYPKRKKWFEKKGIYYVSICLKSNLIEVPNNT